MFVLLLIVNTYQFTIPVSQVACQCSDIPQEDVCTETKKCIWQNDTCTKLNCTQVTDQEWCDVILPNSYKCVWNKGKCEIFTKCSDYVVSEFQDCFNKWFCVEGGPTANGQIQCEDDQTETDESDIICSSFTKDEDCIGNQSDDSTCIWESTKCVNKTLNSCQDAPEQKYCDGMKCYWDEDKKECDELSCEIFKNEDDCNIYYSFDLSSVTQCMWNATECIDYDLVDLDSSQCLNMTLNTYVWNSIQSRCVQCAIDKILNFFYLLLLFIF